MNALYQRLRELDRDSFERLCFHLVNERHPGGDVKHVEGAAGDDGADTFAGQLDSGPIVWQAKAFANGIGQSQKEQIRKSLERAVAKLNPRYWVLCLSIDMDISSHRWWEKLKKSYANKVAIGLWQASDIVTELAHRKAICELFFPGALLNVAELRGLVTGTASASDVQLSALAQENSEQLIERLKARDARFNYQLTVSPETKDALSPPNIAFSVTSGPVTINAFPRDVDALKLDPPRLSFQLLGAGVDKMRAFIETGKPQRFEPEELGRFSTTIRAIDFDADGPRMLSVGQASSPKEHDFALRVTFGGGRDRVVYEYIPFRISRRGSKEVELVSGDKELFRITLVIRDKDGDFTFTEKTLGFSVRSADKWIRAMRALSADGCVEIYDLAAEKRLLGASVTLDSDLGQLSNYEAFFREATEVSDHFGVDLYLRRAVNQADVEAFIFLRRLMEGGTLDVGPITGSIEKADDGGFPAEIWAGKPHALRLDQAGHTLTLLDTSIQTGPYSFTVDVRLQNPAAMYEKWQSATDGALIAFTWEPVGSARIAERVAAPSAAE